MTRYKINPNSRLLTKYYKIRMGNTCIPVADYVKFKNKIKFKIFKKKKKNFEDYFASV